MEEQDSHGPLDSGELCLDNGKRAAKNRIAQRKYRQRQKEKKQSLQQELEGLNRRLESLELERQSLSERHRILQRLAQFADKQGDSTIQGSFRRSATQEPNKKSLKEEAQIAFVNAIHRFKPPISSMNEAMDLMCQQKDMKRFYIETLEDLMARGEMEELEEYILQQRKAKARMLAIVDFKDSLDYQTAKGIHQQDQSPFKQSMVTVMQLTEEQKLRLLAAKKQFLLGCEPFRAQRVRAAQDIKKASQDLQDNTSGDKQNTTARILDGVLANEAFMDSIVMEHRCLRQYFVVCTDLVTPRQEAAALLEGGSEGMWLDMWILPTYIEAEKQGYLKQWLSDNAAQGSSSLNYQKIADDQSITGSSKQEATVSAAGTAYKEEEADLSSVLISPVANLASIDSLPLNQDPQALPPEFSGTVTEQHLEWRSSAVRASALTTKTLKRSYLSAPF